MYSVDNMERVLKFFLDNKLPSNYVVRDNLPESMPWIDKQDLVDCLDVMEEMALITIRRSKDMADGIVFIRPRGLSYFIEQEKALKNERKNDLRWIITTSISIIALIASFLALMR